MGERVGESDVRPREREGVEVSVNPDEQPENPLNPDQPEDPDAAPAPPPVEEPAEDGDQDEGEQEGEQEPEQPSEPSSYARTVEQDKKLSAETKRHTSRISEILGEEATELLTCPVCDPDLQGFMYEAQILQADTPVREAVRTALTPTNEVEYEQDPTTAECTTCRGEGRTATGSKNPRYKLQDCSRCKGYGYVPPPGALLNGTVSHEETRELVPAGGHEPIYEDVDNWGHPRLLNDGRENPNYGRQPQYIDPQFP
jgi:hypothetical protein